MWKDGPILVRHTTWCPRTNWRLIAQAALVSVLVLPAGTEGQDTAIVQPTLARFAVLIGRSADESWHWYHAATPDSRLEYAWLVRIPAEPDYVVGFWLFKRPGSQPSSGSFSDLVGAGQLSTFRGAGLGQLVRGYRPTVRSNADTVFIELTDPRVVAAVFHLRPAMVTIEIVSPQTTTVRRSIPVVYAGF